MANGIHFWHHISKVDGFVRLGILWILVETAYEALCEISHTGMSLTATRQSEMADLARRATRWVGTCHTGMCMSNFMMIGWEMAEILHIEISRKHVSVTYDLDLWPKILKIFVSHGVPIRNMYAKFHNDRLRNGWDITLWNFAKTRTNTDTHTNTQTNRHGHYNTSPSPYGGRGNKRRQSSELTYCALLTLWLWYHWIRSKGPRTHQKKKYLIFFIL